MRLSILLFSLLPVLCAGQIKQGGYSFIQNYSREDYKAGTQNWSIAQDSRGIMYFGNNQGLLSFDGVSWKTYSLPNNSVVQSIYINEEDIIYVGGFNEFGYFIPDSQGDLEYYSLIEKIPLEFREFNAIWNISAHESGILFHSFTNLFYFKEGDLSVLSHGRNLHFSYDVRGKFYVVENGVGILRLEGNELINLPHSGFFESMAVSGILNFDEENLLIVTRESGLYLLSGSGVKEFKTDLDYEIRNNQIFTAGIYKNRYIALGTVQSGLILIDKSGNMIQHLNREHGLQNNTVLCLFTDANQNMWLGLDNGIDFILLNSPFSFLADESEIGAAYVLEQTDSKLFIGTNQGLYTMTWPTKPDNANTSEIIKLIPGSQGQVWALRKTQNMLLMGHDKGAFQVENDDLQRITSVAGILNFISVPGNSEMLLSGTYSGIVASRVENAGAGKSQLHFHDFLAGFYEPSSNLAFDNKGYLWIAHDYRGLYRLRINEAMDSVIENRHYSEYSGLPPNQTLNIIRLNGQLFVYASDGLYRYDHTKDVFEKDLKLSKLFAGHSLRCIQEDENGNIWFFTAKNIGVLKPNFDGTYSKSMLPFTPLMDKIIPGYENVYSLDRNNILFPTIEGLIHFDPTYDKDYNESFQVRIRSVVLPGDSVIFGGYSAKSSNRAPEIKFTHNSMSFAFSAIHFEFAAHNEFSYMLDGFDDNWSEWTHSSEKEYTNLREGDYRFLVKAKNIYGVESSAEPFEFSILPPWYRSKVAYLTYLIFFILFIVLVIRYVLKRMEEERLELRKKQKAAMQEKERQYAEESMRVEQEIIKLQNEKLEIENQRNKSELENKTKELASIAMQITYKNELLNQVKHKLRKVSGKMLHRDSKQQVELLIKTLEKDIINQDDWEKFEVHFDQVHEDFMKKLRANFPELTPKDLRLCAYLRMNLSSKEIAPLLNISIRGVEISRYRLRKKLYLDRDVNLTDFMMKL